MFWDAFYWSWFWVSTAAGQQNVLQSACRLCSVETWNWSTKINVSELWIEMPVWETAIRSSRTRVKGTACFGVEDSLCVWSSIKEPNSKKVKNYIRLSQRMASDSLLLLVGLCLLQTLILEHSLSVTLRWECFIFEEAELAGTVGQGCHIWKEPLFSPCESQESAQFPSFDLRNIQAGELPNSLACLGAIGSLLKYNPYQNAGLYTILCVN